MIKHGMINQFRNSWRIAGLLLVLVLGCGRTDIDPNLDDRHTPMQTKQQIDPWSAYTYAQRRGKAHYEHFCIHCHGASGRGDGSNAFALTTPPRDFSQPHFFETRHDSVMERFIHSGGRIAGLSNTMPPFGGSLQKRTIQQIVTYLKTFPPTHEGNKKEEDG